MRTVCSHPRGLTTLFTDNPGMRNSLICAAGRDTVNADMDSVLIAAPHWFSKEDVDAGSAQPSDIFFHGSTYQRGNAAIGPGEADISSYEAYV